MDKASKDDTVMEVVDAVEVGVGVVDTEAAPGLDPEVVVKVLVNMAAGSSVLGVGVAKRGFSKLPPPGT